MDAAESIKVKLDEKGIHSLRQIGRVIGVSFPKTRRNPVRVLLAERLPSPRITTWKLWTK